LSQILLLFFQHEWMQSQLNLGILCCIRVHKIDCIWVKSLDCGSTSALLNTHCSSSYNIAQCSRAKLTSSHSYQGPTPAAFVTHTAPAITLVPNSNKQSAAKSAIQMKA